MKKPNPSHSAIELADMTDRNDEQHVLAQSSITEPPSTEKKGNVGMGNFIRILKLGDKLDYLMMGICTISALGAGIAMPLMFLVFGKLVGDFTNYFRPDLDPTNAITKEKFIQTLDKNTLYMLYLGVGRFVLSYISMLSIRVSGLRISARLRLMYLRKLFLQPVSTIDETSAGTIASRLTININTIESGISQQFSLAIQAVTFTIGLYVVSFIKSALLTLVASAAIPIVLIVWGVVLPLNNKYWYASEAIKEQASSLVFEIFESIRIVVAFGAEDRLGTKHNGLLSRSKRFDKKQAPLMGLLMSSMFLSVYATFSLAIWFGIKQYMGGKIDGINTIIGTVLFSVLWAVMTFGRLYSPLIRIARAAAQSADIFEVLDSVTPNTTGLHDPYVSASDDIIFRNVTFAYPSRPGITILDKLNIQFEAKKTTAIVGPSGSGKSTVVGLLEKWYDPAIDFDNDLFAAATSSQGRQHNIFEKSTANTSYLNSQSGIYIGNVELGSIGTKWWRSQIGLVQQEPFLFNDTIYGNVAFGLSGTMFETASREDKLILVKNACREAFADEFVERLPQGYDTMVGEGGMRLSGGQRQRIAIARAIIKQPQILILDEATSAIDVRSERIVQEALDRVSRSRTTIVIAHRLSTIMKADKIVVVHRGKVVEQGTHEELVGQHDGMYSGFVRAQAVEALVDSHELDFGFEHEDEMLIADEKQDYIETTSIATQDIPLKPRKVGAFGSFGILLFEQRARWGLYLFVLLGAMGGGATYPLQAYLFAKVVATFTMLREQLVHEGNWWALMFAILGGGVGAAFLVLGWTASLISMDVSSFYRQDYLVNILKKPISFFDEDENSAGSLTSRIGTDSSQIQQLLGNEMGMALVAVFSILGSIIISFVFGWKLSLVGVLALMPIVLIAGYYRVHLETAFEQLNAKVFAESSQFGSEAIAGFRTVTALIMEDGISARFELLLSTHIKKAIHKAKWSTIVFAFSDSADVFCQALCFWYGGRLLANKEYDIVAFFVVYMAVIQSSLAAGMWFSFSPNIVEATSAANRMLSVRPARPSLLRPEVWMPQRSEPAAIDLQDVWFSYEERATPVIKGVSLRIEAGQFAAFVGASGSGKSTMISLLERFYNPSAGRILMDSVDVADFEPASYRRNLSLVAQESSLYEGTIRENVALSVPEEEATDVAIEQACRAAQIHDFIASLPEGYSTLIGSRGTALSGGQRQRLSLARALLRAPQVLLLDEATSNLDSESERMVQQAIEEAAGDGRRTIIAVAHRLATIQKADVIFVMGDGRVLERGTHKSLVAKRGIYWNLCQAQALDR